MLVNSSSTLSYIKVLYSFSFSVCLSYNRNSNIEVLFFPFFDSIMYYFTCTLFLVSATITEITIRCTTKIVHIIWTTVSHIDVCWPATAVTTPVKTRSPADLTVCYCGVSTIQPGGCMSATSVCRWTWRWHSYACWPLETKPARSDSTVTITVVSSVGNLSVTAVKTCVILTFWYRKIKIIVSIRINLTFKKLENYLIF